jgi:hypothetical protein
MYASHQGGTPLSGWYSWITGWWREPERWWYSLRIVGSGGAWWTEDRYLTEREATEWQLDAIEEHWGSNVYRYYWNGHDWVYG